GRIGVTVDPKEGPDATSFRELTGGLKDPCAPVRLGAVLALSNLGAPTKAADLKTEKDGLETCLKDRDKVVALCSRTLLMYIDEKNYLNDKNLTVLAKYMDDSELHVRIEGANALAQLGRKAQGKLTDLISAANDKEIALALAATAALGRLDDPDAVGP